MHEFGEVLRKNLQPKNAQIKAKHKSDLNLFASEFKTNEFELAAQINEYRNDLSSPKKIYPS